MAEIGSSMSRRSLLMAIAVAPIAAAPGNPATMGWSFSTKPLLTGVELPPRIARSREGRSASRFRYHNAEGFFHPIESGRVHDAQDLLYQTGIVLQLGLSAYLFDVGFTDEWCARNIGLNVARSLAYANATGFGFESDEFNLLAAILSPYGRWRIADSLERVDDLPFTPDQVRFITRDFLDHVHRVTGHPRPRGWSIRHG